MNPIRHRFARLLLLAAAGASALVSAAAAVAADARPEFTPPSAASLPDTEFGKICLLYTSRCV